MIDTADRERLVERALTGDRRAVARLISLVENRAPGISDVLARLHREGSRAYLVGVTGPPGGGKSTLVMQLVRRFRQAGKEVGVIAVDPTSPFTGGAILGDRVRMQDVMTDPGVFIRSMATRGHLGGLAEATSDVARVLEASGKDVVVIETVGAGQAEVDIARTAHTTLVIEVPGMGDEVQAIKAGLMEIADIFVVNKADHDNADRVTMALEMALRLGPPGDWKPPIVKVVAVRGRGIDELMEQIEKHHAFLGNGNRLAEREAERIRFQILEMARERFTDRLLSVLSRGELDQIIADVVARKNDPYAAVEALLARLGLRR